MITLNNKNKPIELLVNDDSYSYEAIMGDDTLTLYFSHPGFIDIPVGSYCDFYGKRYSLRKDSNFKKNGIRDFEYTLILETSKADAALWKVRNMVDNRIKFSFTAKPKEHLQLLVDNLNRHSSGWTVGECLQGTEKTIEYNHTYILDGLNQLANSFETEWQIVDKTIHLRKVEYNKDNPLTLSYGKGNGFKTGVGRESGDVPSEIILVQGTDRNINFSKYGSKELLLPKSQTLEYEGRLYKTSADGTFVMRADKDLTTAKEDSLDCTEIYPSRTGKVSEVVPVDADSNFYDFTDDSIPENLNFEDCLIEGEKMTVIFQTGMLVGKEFDVKYIHKAKDGKKARRFEIVPQETDGITMPGGEAWMPKPGDEYIVFGIQLPDAYICDDATKTGASWDMFREAAKYLYEHEEKSFTFRGTLDGIWAKKRWLQIGGKIVLGGYVNFSDAQFHPGGSLIRMTGIKRYVNNPYSPEIELSNDPVGTSITSDLNKIETNEVVVEDKYRNAIQFTKRRFRDAQETMDMLSASLLNFSGSVNPITVATMQMLVGDESLQFRFVNNMTEPRQVSHVITYDSENRTLNSPAGIIQHMTLGIRDISSAHKVGDYKFWSLGEYTSPILEDADKGYYLYAKVSKSKQTGDFVLSETPVKPEQIEGCYHLLVGVLNKEYDGERSFVELYGFTEILPGRITTERIVSVDGQNFMDFANNAFRVGNNNNYFDWNSRGDGKLRLKGTLIQSESGDESPVGCFRGGYSSGHTYYNGDEVTFDDGTGLSTYRYIHSTPGMGFDPTNGVYWIVVARGNKGETGAAGSSGADGDYYEYRYAVNGSRSTPPLLVNTDVVPAGWSVSMPAVGSLQYLWMTSAKKEGASGKLLINWSTPVRATPYDGVDGAKGANGSNGVDGKDAPASVYRGIYNSSTPYYGMDERVDIVQYRSHYYIARRDVGREFTGTDPTNKEYWNDFGAEFESVATNLLLAEEANIAGFIFRNGRMESQDSTNGVVNVILDGGNNFASFAAGKVTFDKDTAKVGWVNIEGDDLIGFDDKGNKKLIITKGAVPVSNDITEGGEKFLKKDAFGPVEVVQYSSGNSGTGGDFHYGSNSNSGDNYNVRLWMFDTYYPRNHDYEGSVRFKIPFKLEETSYVTFNTSLGITSDKVQNRSTMYLYKSDGTSVMSNIDNSRNLLDAGSYYLEIYMNYSTPSVEDENDVYALEVYFNIDSVKIERLLNCNILGSNGLVSRYGANKYLYFSDNEGFEVRFGKYGIRVNESGLSKYSNNSWVPM